MERRNFLIWLGLAITGILFLVGNLFKKIWFYILGPNLTVEQEAKLIQEKIVSLERQTRLEKLRMDRFLNDRIYVCRVDQLKAKEGLSFVDFNLKPALAFRGKDGKPVLISSVCTHLGCTVQNKLKKGRLLCPCHISYFEVESGKVLEGPAKIPLPMIPFIVDDEKIYIIKNV